jgi:rhamnogalacturonyl hydrolase YesR
MGAPQTQRATEWRYWSPTGPARRYIIFFDSVDRGIVDQWQFNLTYALASPQGSDFSAAASDQLTWLLNDVPRSSKGAISHRNNGVQLWSDFIYMVPPFLAYYGATTSNKTLITESYHQIKLYRDVLLDTSGLWQHIRQGSFEDKGLWSTGNGWATMGMMRVAATIKAAGYESEFTDELKDLSDWTAGIFDAMWPLLVSSFVLLITFC